MPKMPFPVAQEILRNAYRHVNQGLITWTTSPRGISVLNQQDVAEGKTFEEEPLITVYGTEEYRTTTFSGEQARDLLTLGKDR